MWRASTIELGFACRRGGRWRRRRRRRRDFGGRHSQLPRIECRRTSGRKQSACGGFEDLAVGFQEVDAGGDAAAEFVRGMRPGCRGGAGRGGRAIAGGSSTRAELMRPMQRVASLEPRCGVAMKIDARDIGRRLEVERAGEVGARGRVGDDRVERSRGGGLPERVAAGGDLHL